MASVNVVVGVISFDLQRINSLNFKCILIGSQTDNASMLKPLLEQIRLLISKVAVDGAYDRQNS